MATTRIAIRVIRERLTRWTAALSVALLLLLTQAAVPATPNNNGASPSEHAVKAAMIYRIAKFIEWPADAFADRDSPFVVCVVGDDALLQAFDSLSGRAVNGHAVQVRRITGDMLDLRQCHTAFFALDAQADIDYALAKLQGLPVLTVGEADDFARRGGILALLTREQRVTFALNLPVSKQARLSISAQLLQLATIVGAKP